MQGCQIWANWPPPSLPESDIKSKLDFTKINTHFDYLPKLWNLFVDQTPNLLKCCTISVFPKQWDCNLVATSGVQLSWFLNFTICRQGWSQNKTLLNVNSHLYLSAYNLLVNVIFTSWLCALSKGP